MSEEEQHAIAGKMVADYVQTKRELVALNNKSSDFAGVLRRIAGKLAASCEPDKASALADTAWDQLIEQYPTREEVASIASEIASLAERKLRLSSSLRQLGVEPKE